MHSNAHRDEFEVVPTGILLVKAGRVIYGNAVACSLLMREVEDLKGVDPLELFHHDDRDRIQKKLREMEEGVRACGGHTYRAIRSDGTVLSVEVEATALKEEESVILVILLIDATRRRRMEEGLQQIQKMEAIGQLAAGIAHDFNNLLGAMINYLTLISTHGAPSGEVGHYLRDIKGLVERGQALVRQILNTSRKRPGDFTVHDLNDVLKPIVRMLDHTLPKWVSIQVEEGNVPAFCMDAGQLQQVIMNLCINAADAMPEGGEIRIRTDRSRVSREAAEAMPGAQPGSYARITVSDSGVGMSPEVTQRIFDPFFTTKTERERSGLGLSICSAIVRGHGGFMDVESELGRGTTVSVYVPLVEGAPPRVAPVPSKVVEGQETLLLVDDEPNMLESTALLLRDLGYRTLTACGGPEALEVFSDHAGEIQLVLMDLGMPGMDGTQAFRKLREINPGVRGLILTGLPQSEEALEALREGFVGVVQKPFRIEDLSQEIRRALEES